LGEVEFRENESSGNGRRGTQLEYLTMMREAARDGNAEAGRLTLLEDRVAVTQRKKEVYGGQVMPDDRTGKYHIDSLEDPIHIRQKKSCHWTTRVGALSQCYGELNGMRRNISAKWRKNPVGPGLSSMRTHFHYSRVIPFCFF
jgi:hypothetical protein